MKIPIITTFPVLLLLTLAPVRLTAMPPAGEMIEVFRTLPTTKELHYVDLIIPKQKIGPFAFTMQRADALLYLGEPDRIFYQGKNFSLKALPEEYYFLYTTLGVAFLFRRGDLVELTSFSPRYKFPNGVCVGSTEARVTATFGDAYQLVEGATQDTLVYPELGVSFRISKQKRIVWEIALARQTEKAGPAGSFNDLLNQEVPKLDLSRTTRSDLVRIFGEPLAYRWGEKTFTRDNLPLFYVAEFLNRFTALIREETVVELGFHRPGFKYGAVLEVGSTLEEALALLGPPLGTVQKQARNFKSGILYYDIGTEEGTCYYEKAEWGVRLFFKEYKISAIYLTEPP